MAVTTDPTSPPAIGGSHAPHRATEGVAPHLAQATVAGQAVDLLLVGAAMAGVDRAALVADVGIPAEFLDPPAGAERPRVPAPRVMRLWAELALRSGREHFGLWLAEHLVDHHGETLGGHVVRTAPTLGDGLRRMIAVERIFHGVEILSLTVDGPTARVAHRAPMGVGPGAGPAVDFGFAWMVLIARRTTGHDVRADAVRLVRPRPADTRPWIEALGVEPTFGAELDVLEIPAGVLDLPQVTADALVARLVEQHTRALLDALPSPATDGGPDRGLVAAARAFVGRCVAESRPEDAELRAFAARERVAPRTLQRRLAALGTSFVAIADAARADLARHHLRAGASIAEVAVALGFADQAAFHKAFMRWEGTTPGTFARVARSAGSATRGA